MDGKKTTVVGIVLLLIGLLAGYLFWGYRMRDLSAELANAKAKLAEAQQVAAQEATMAAKLKDLEAQLKQVTERLNSERQAREQLQAQVSKGKK